MKVSELIFDLEILMSQSGDCEVFIETDNRQRVPLSSVHGELGPMQSLSGEWKYIVVLE